MASQENITRNKTNKATSGNKESLEHRFLSTILRLEYSFQTLILKGRERKGENRRQARK